VRPARACATEAAGRDLQIGGVAPFSAVDFPGRLAAVVFCQGCPWRCRYCQNPHLLPRAQTQVLWADVLALLKRRRGLLDAVVFCGGEPTLHTGLREAMGAARALGFAVGLHTAGPYPGRLKALLPYLDWIGMDIKAPFADYARITGARGSGDKARKSAELVLASGIAHEFRTTVHPLLLDRAQVLALARELVALGAERYVLQTFRAIGCADTELVNTSDLAFVDATLCMELRALFPHFSVRTG